MGWILIQPAQDDVSLEAVKLLSTTGECKFNTSLDGPRLKPIVFGSRSYTIEKSKLHYFTGESACERWQLLRIRSFSGGELLVFWFNYDDMPMGTGSIGISIYHSTPPNCILEKI